MDKSYRCWKQAIKKKDLDELLGMHEGDFCQIFSRGTYQSYETGYFTYLYFLPKDMSGRNAADRAYCDIPDIFRTYYASSVDLSPKKVYRSFDENSIGHSQDQVWIEHVEIYYLEKLPCNSKYISFLCKKRDFPISAD